jgi:CDP-4-dehydro-6-deoxyglucose reductase
LAYKIKIHGRDITCENGVSVLQSALDANIALAYSCANGRCGACKVQVLSGQVLPIVANSGSNSSDKLGEGWILSCANAPASDLVIEAEVLDGITLPKSKVYPVRIADIQKINSRVILVKLRLPPAIKFECVAGQYIDVIGVNGCRRSYSVANLTNATNLIELQIRYVENGIMSQYWFNEARVNDLLRINGPLGSFVLRDMTNLHLVFLATGTGIAPVKAMIESIDSNVHITKPISINLYWGGRTKEDLYLDPSVWSPHVEYTSVLSREDDKNSHSHFNGYVQEALLMLSKNDFARSVIYACGSKSMIDSSREELIKNGLPADKFFADVFVCSS